AQLTLLYARRGGVRQSGNGWAYEPPLRFAHLAHEVPFPGAVTGCTDNRELLEARSTVTSLPGRSAAVLREGAATTSVLTGLPWAIRRFRPQAPRCARVRPWHGAMYRTKYLFVVSRRHGCRSNRLDPGRPAARRRDRPKRSDCPLAIRASFPSWRWP